MLKQQPYFKTQVILLLFAFLYVVDGSWSDWSSWQLCTEEGVQCNFSSSVYIKTRTCDNPKPFGGAECKGENSTELSLGMISLNYTNYSQYCCIVPYFSFKFLLTLCWGLVYSFKMFVSLIEMNIYWLEYIIQGKEVKMRSLLLNLQP